MIYNNIRSKMSDEISSAMKYYFKNQKKIQKYQLDYYYKNKERLNERRRMFIDT